VSDNGLIHIRGANDPTVCLILDFTPEALSNAKTHGRCESEDAPLIMSYVMAHVRSHAPEPSCPPFGEPSEKTWRAIEESVFHAMVLLHAPVGEAS
jgi:hypothetical protein